MQKWLFQSGYRPVCTALVLLLGVLTTFITGSPVHAAPLLSHPSVAHPNVIMIKSGLNPHGGGTGGPTNCLTGLADDRCYVPQQIQNAYNVTPLLKAGITGKGRTIVIIDAYQSPTIQADLKLFDQNYGLPDPTFNIIAPDGLTPFDYSSNEQVRWAEEVSLDVEWSHAIAPGATIDLVLAKSSADADITNVTKYAVDHNLGDVISQSFGEGESCADPALTQSQHQIFQEATRKHITLIASSGDTGAVEPSQQTPVACGGSAPYFQSVQTPASDPLVASVGGTHLVADVNTGAYQSENVWFDMSGGSGGGYSSVYPRPSYQDSVVQNAYRGVPDVAYDGDPMSGMLTVWSSSVPNSPPTLFVGGGTSAGAPQWAAIAVLADQLANRRLGFLNSAIYRIGKSHLYSYAFQDVTVGNNAFRAGDTIYPGYDATAGWDPATGWGSPNVAHLVPLLLGSIFPSDGYAL